MAKPVKLRNTNEPDGMKLPRDREFLGLVKDGNHVYWDFFWYATKKEGSDRPCFVDRDFYDMPNIVKWIECPPLDITE